MYLRRVTSLHGRLILTSAVRGAMYITGASRQSRTIPITIPITTKRVHGPWMTAVVDALGLGSYFEANITDASLMH